MTKWTQYHLENISDEYIESVLYSLNKAHRAEGKWLSMTSCARAMKKSPMQVKAALFNLAAMGFLNIRHEDGSEDLLYQLRRDYRR